MRMWPFFCIWVKLPIAVMGTVSYTMYILTERTKEIEMGRTRAYPRSQSSIDRERKANHLDRYKMRECRFFEYTNEGRRQTPKAIFLNGIWLPLSQSWHWDIYDTREWNKSIYMCSIVAIPKWLAKKKDMSLFKEIELTHLYGGYENQGYQVSIF